MRGDMRITVKVLMSDDRHSIMIHWNKELYGGAIPITSFFKMTKPFVLDCSYESIGLEDYLTGWRNESVEPPPPVPSKWTPTTLSMPPQRKDLQEIQETDLEGSRQGEVERE